MNAGKATAWMQQNKICISLLMLVLTATCGMVSYNLTSEAGDLGRRSFLEPPEVRLVQNHENTGEAIHHVHQAATSWNRITASPKVHPADQEDWKKHTANAAVQRGWYPHTGENQQLNLIVPERDRNLLEGLEEDAYDWLENVSVQGAPAIAPEVGKRPAARHVNANPCRRRAKQHDASSAGPHNSGIPVHGSSHRRMGAAKHRTEAAESKIPGREAGSMNLRPMEPEMTGNLRNALLQWQNEGGRR